MNQLKAFIKKHKLKIILSLGLLLAIGIIQFCNLFLAGVEAGVTKTFYANAQEFQLIVPHKEQPEIEVCEVLDEYKTIVTAYNAGDPNQCDNSPCIASNGENICTALALGYKRCASNKYLFGTTLEVEGYGKCIVVDRMNKRFTDRVDVAFTAEKKTEAMAFGGHERNIKVLRCK